MNTALIFAAGRGERLKNITRHLPKALCKVFDIPLIERHIIQLKKAGFDRILINHAYLGDQIKRYLGTGERFQVHIEYIPEPPGGLETAGTLIHALPFFEGQPFITVNADIYTDFNFSKLKKHSQNYAEAHLILVPHAKTHAQGDFGLNKSKVQNTPRSFVYSGIARFNPQLFEPYSLKRISLTPLLRTWADQQKITGELYSGMWYDIGTPERLEQVQKTLAYKNT